MSLENFSIKTSFSWLAKEVRRARDQRAEQKNQPTPTLSEISVEEIERGLLKAKELRALQLGQMLGSAVRSASHYIHHKAA